MKYTYSDTSLFAVIALSVAVPFFAAVAAGVSIDAGTGAATTDNTPMEGIFVPRSENRNLFDSAQFKQMRRDRRMTLKEDSPATATVNDHPSSVAPCKPAADEQPAPAATAPTPLRIGDLTDSQRRDLQLQLRNKVCPYGVPGYSALCEQLLKAGNLFHKPLTGTVNPELNKVQQVRADNQQ